MIRIILYITATLLSLNIQAKEFGVDLVWATKNISEAEKYFSIQNENINNMVISGEVKDIFVNDIVVEGIKTKIVKLVISADNINDVNYKLSKLPLLRGGMLSVNNIVDLGDKWLDNLPPLKSYGLEFTWKQKLAPMDIDRALSDDLKLVIELYSSGILTSSYLNVQELTKKISRPIYLLTVVAKDKDDAKKIALRFKSIEREMADVKIYELGVKVDKVP
ncbi:hypothetical protein [Vibrio harveyi]|uniref:hypothetical protein n=1 Tax=Vibrio harveyi TaxID=669 RepID=UPI000C7DD831|nr:hypothetical protein [Vibrio harveyi]